VPPSDQKPLTYRDAGVDIDAGDALVEAIRPLARATRRPECLGGLGGFGALVEVPLDRYRQPVLVAGTDGVGTKLKLALALGRHEGIGIDLVAMCANDVLVQGAEPLFFLDYYATGRLDLETARRVIAGIAEGCRQAGAALVGGETAEMPGVYQGDDYDLAGFCVGIVEKARLLDGGAIRPGHAVIGLAASGPHANGYSLIRRVLEVSGADLDQALDDGRRLADALIAPTRIYVKPVLKLLARLPVAGIAHITGGGLPGNLARILPAGTAAVIRAAAWTRPPVFDWLQRAGRIPAQEMWRTFNCGIGMTLVLAPEHAAEAVAMLDDAGEEARVIGEIVAAEGEPRVAIR